MPPTGVLDGRLDLPPGFRLIALREAGDAFAHAKTIAAQEGAGTVVHVGRYDLAEFALVLEPDEPLRTARRALYAGSVALSDALAAFAPPERPVELVLGPTRSGSTVALSAACGSAGHRVRRKPRFLTGWCSGS